MGPEKIFVCISAANSLVQIGYKNKVNISEIHDAHNFLRIQLNHNTTAAITFFLACILIIFYLAVRYKYL